MSDIVFKKISKKLPFAW